MQRLRLRLSRVNEALRESGSPANIATADVVGGLFGWAAAMGAKYAVRKIGDVKAPGAGWADSLTRTGLGAGVMAANLAIPYDRPQDGMRRAVGSAGLVLFFNGLDSTIGKGYEWWQGRKAKALAEQAAQAAALAAAAQAAQAAAKK